MLSSPKRALLIVLDGVGAGELPDAAQYGDAGSHTLLNTSRAVGGLSLPALAAFGLGNIVAIEGVGPVRNPRASYGKMAEISKGKDSTTGHWELLGLSVKTEFPTFPGGFPAALMDRFISVTGCGGYLGNRAASGTVIIQELGEEHCRTGFPIVYTSADSVFQIAAHEGVIPLDRLYTLCRQTRDEVCTGRFTVGRVIARPFVGTGGSFVRTTNRRDFSLLPPGLTLLDVLGDGGVETVGIGKIEDLLGGRGLSRSTHARTNDEGVACILSEMRRVRRAFLMANLGDFDTLFGHRNDPAGFAKALEVFDTALPRIVETLDPGDLLIITADHGNDPVTPSTDHSREYVPLLCFSKSRSEGSNLGTRTTFADVGKTIAHYFGLENALEGTSFLSMVN